MAESKKIYTSQQYYANFEGDAGNTPANFKGLGYYSRTSLEDIINNFNGNMIDNINSDCYQLFQLRIR